MTFMWLLFVLNEMAKLNREYNILYLLFLAINFDFVLYSSGKIIYRVLANECDFL